MALMFIVHLSNTCQIPQVGDESSYCYTVLTQHYLIAVSICLVKQILEKHIGYYNRFIHTD